MFTVALIAITGISVTTAAIAIKKKGDADAEIAVKDSVINSLKRGDLTEEEAERIREETYKSIMSPEGYKNRCERLKK